jgi:hypothetical protein
LQSTRFYSEVEIRESLKELHSKIQSDLPIIVRKTKAQRRKDLWVTYLDGAGKSGAQYASMFSEVNLISTTCVKEISELDKQLLSTSASTQEVSTIVIVDDFIGTGNTLIGSLNEFYSKHGDLLTKKGISVYVLVVTATKGGEDKVRQKLSKLDSSSDLLVHNSLETKYHAFHQNNKIWEDENELLRAKDLCQSLGVNLNKRKPLGYGEQGLLLVFPRNCPNNTLPIFHSKGNGNNAWIPLFERSKR